MTTLEETTTTVWGVPNETFDEAQLAAVAFLARYSGRTLDAYRHDLRAFFQWATDKQLIVLKATRSHIELYRAAMEESGLGRPRSTVASDRGNDRPTWRRAPRTPDPAPQRRATFGSSHRAPVGPFDRQARQSRNGPSAHAPRGVHHGRVRRRCAPTRRTNRCPARRPAHHNHLRPP